MVSQSPSAAWHAHLSHPDAGPALNLALGDPLAVLSTCALGELKSVLATAQQMVAKGHVLVGGLSYEAAPAFDPALVCKPPSHMPLVHFHVYHPEQISTVPIAQLQPLPEQAVCSPWLDEQTLTEFFQLLDASRQAILDGEFYQLNLTTRLRATQLKVSGWALFQHLFLAQPAQQSVFLHTPAFDLLSLSPELFFSWDGQTIVTSPMKGTRKTPGSNLAPLPGKLSDSEKDRAENVMIVDLLRNDLAKVCEPRSVQVRSLFDVMTLPTVEQMTSTISGRTRAGVSVLDVFEALFPCGSVTGAPKTQAMRRIAEWEKAPRHFYCGALGVMQGNRAHFNVPIRTVLLEHQAPNGTRLEYGVGSGITWYSDVLAEKREWWQKTEFLRNSTVAFDLLETVLLEAGQWQHLELHLERMARAANWFSWAWDEAAVRSELDAVARNNPQARHRGRWVLRPDGQLLIELHPAPEPLGPVSIRLASRPMPRACAEFVRFKTTHRPHYDAFASEANGVFDVLLYQDDGSLTETCRCNLVVQLGDCFYTPTLDDKHKGNLLAGVYRHCLLSNNTIEERAITIDELRGAKAVWLINSLRGWLPVTEVVLPEQTLYFPESPAPI